MNSSASAPSRTTWIWLARLFFLKACKASLTSLGLSSTKRISTPLGCIGSPSFFQSEVKRSPLARLRFGPDPPPMAVDDALDDRQAHARALIVLGAVEALEDAEELVGVAHVKADAVVLDEVGPP